MKPSYFNIQKSEIENHQSLRLGLRQSKRDPTRKGVFERPL